MAVLAKTNRRARGAFLGAFMAVTLVLAALAVGLWSFNPLRTEEVDRSGPAVLERIRELEEFTAAQAEFVQDVDLESDTRYVPSALKGERVVAIASGEVRATVDLGGLDDEGVSISEDGSSISLRLPQPVLGDPEVHESDTRIVARQRGLVDRFSDLVSANPFDDRELYALAEAKLGDAAEESGLEATARSNTERWLETFLGAAGFDEVVISWETDPV